MSSEDEIKVERESLFQKAIENFNTEEEVHRRFDPGTFGSHEAADRTWMIAENVESYILNHPTVVMNEEAFRKVYEASQLLYDVYQIIACADFKEEENERSISDTKRDE